MNATPTISKPVEVTPVRAPAPGASGPLFVSENPRGSEVSAPLVAIIVPILLSAVGMLLVFLGQWNNPFYLALACSAAVYSLGLCAMIGVNRLRNRPVRPSWIAGVIVLTVYLGPATAMVGFVRLLDQLGGVFSKAVSGETARRLPFDLDPRTDLLSAVLLAVCATAFIVGCSVFWLEVVALRGRIGEIERAVLGGRDAAR